MHKSFHVSIWVIGKKSFFDEVFIGEVCSLEASDPLQYFSSLVNCDLNFFERGSIYIEEPDYLKT